MRCGVSCLRKRKSRSAYPRTQVSPGLGLGIITITTGTGATGGIQSLAGQENMSCTDEWSTHEDICGHESIHAIRWPMLSRQFNPACLGRHEDNLAPEYYLAEAHCLKRDRPPPKIFCSLSDWWVHILQCYTTTSRPTPPKKFSVRQTLQPVRAGFAGLHALGPIKRAHSQQPSEDTPKNHVLSTVKTVCTPDLPCRSCPGPFWRCPLPWRSHRA